MGVVDGALLPFILLQGAANDMATLARATSLAELFGAKHYGAIAGAVALGANGARAIGPVGASLLWVGLGSYPSVFWLLAASLVIAAAAMLISGARQAKRRTMKTSASPVSDDSHKPGEPAGSTGRP